MIRKFQMADMYMRKTLKGHFWFGFICGRYESMLLFCVGFFLLPLMVITMVFDDDDPESRLKDRLHWMRKQAALRRENLRLMRILRRQHGKDPFQLERRLHHSFFKWYKCEL